MTPDKLFAQFLALRAETKHGQKSEKSRFICTMPPAVFQEPYGGRCGHVFAVGEKNCPDPHARHVKPFSQRAASRSHVL